MHIDTLPPGCEAEFVGEGAANVVFAIKPPKNQSSLQGKLLRVPKAGTKAYPHPELQDYWENAIQPLFNPDDLVQQCLVRLEGSGIVLKINALLSENQTSRRADFRDHSAADAEFGMLVEDMRQRRPGDVVFEFKPKWLTQSPSAPSSARRCRNCAREALRNNKNGTSKPIPCPLDLLQCRTDAATRDRVLYGNLGVDGDNKPPIPEVQLDRLVYWLENNRVVERLRDAQVKNDPDGPPKADASRDPRFQLAMTLRDCTCFIRIPADAGEPVEAKLGDLDKKNGEAKLGYWQSMERRLAEEGYYEGKEVPPQKTACQLEREL